MLRKDLEVVALTSAVIALLFAGRLSARSVIVVVVLGRLALVLDFHFRSVVLLQFEEEVLRVGDGVVIVVDSGKRVGEQGWECRCRWVLLLHSTLCSSPSEHLPMADSQTAAHRSKYVRSSSSPNARSSRCESAISFRPVPASAAFLSSSLVRLKLNCCDHL